MKRIPLLKDKYALVDDEDFDYLNQWNWQTNAYGYAVRSKYVGNYKGVTYYMHREIMSTPKGKDTDHINRDKLDNRKQNLRICKHANNMKNLGLRKDNTSGVKGVRWHKQLQKWNARIHVNGKEISLGCFHDLKEAAKAYKDASIKYHGVYAS